MFSGSSQSNVCTDCGGNGKSPRRVCLPCGGGGKYPVDSQGYGPECGTCDGNGFTQEDCFSCGGSGLLNDIYSPETSSSADGYESSSWGFPSSAALLDGTQTVLDVAGMLPVVGEPADGINALICLARKDYIGAGMSAGSMIPFAGWGTAAAKWIKRIDDLPAGTIIDSSVLNKMSTTASNVRESEFFNGLSSALQDAVSRGISTSENLSDLLRQVSKSSDDWLDDVLARSELAKSYRKDIAKGIDPIAFDPRTAGTGGIHSIHVGISKGNELVSTVTGEVKLPRLDKAGHVIREDFEDTLVKPSLIEALDGLNYERAHLWGPRFGDEAAAGTLYAPRALNRGMQSDVEKTIRGIRDNLRFGEQIILQARSTSYPRNLYGGATMRSVEYDFLIVNTTGGLNTVVDRIGLGFHVGPPSTTTTWYVEHSLEGFVWQ